MDNLLTIALEAHHAELNHHRRYEISIGRDLLSDWTVCIRYGRVGQSGQERRFGSSSRESMVRIVREHLRRRLSAPKRIGCSYRLTGLSSTADFDTADWLPFDMLGTFLFQNQKPVLEACEPA